MKKISLFLAILININIVIGGAFFLTAGSIAKKSGAYAPLAWIIVGAMLLPLVLVLANLSNKYAVSGGIYIFSHDILGPLPGFISGWGYYIGTAAGNAVIIHAFRELSDNMGISKPLFNTLGLSGLGSDIFLIVLFAICNLFNIKLLSKIQGLLTLLKSIPLVLLIGSSFFLFNTSNLSVSNLNPLGVLESVPLVLFAYLGIEACCAIGHLIADGDKNTSKAILISFGLIVSIYAFAQLCVVAIHGGSDANPFSGIIPMLTNNQRLIDFGTGLINFSILSSFLGGFYSMFYTNNWNLFAIAQEKKLPGSNTLINLNGYGAPTGCITIQTLLIVALLILTTNMESLVTMSDFGVVVAYLLSTIAFLALNKSIVGILSLLSCSYLLYASFGNLMEAGTIYLIPYLALLGFGIIAYFIQNKR